MAEESVVHEYSILYSTRVIQKDKRWNDGVLRFYEFNNKLEILNDHINLIATDFYPKNKKNPTCGVFKSGFEYKFTNNKIILEIDDYIRSYKRDISKLFKKSTMSPTVVKQEPISSVNSSTYTHTQSTPRPRAVGLSRSLKKIKQEVIEPSPLNRPNGAPTMPIQVKKEPGSSISENTVQKVTKKSVDGVKSKENGVMKFLESLQKYKFDSSPTTRILPNSSRRFQHLKRKTNVEKSSESPYVSMEVKIEQDQTEPQGNTIPQNISDFEEEEKFFDMIRELREKSYDSEDDK